MAIVMENCHENFTFELSRGSVLYLQYPARKTYALIRIFLKSRVVGKREN